MQSSLRTLRKYLFLSLRIPFPELVEGRDEAIPMSKEGDCFAPPKLGTRSDIYFQD